MVTFSNELKVLEWEIEKKKSKQTDKQTREFFSPKQKNKKSKVK